MEIGDTVIVRGLVINEHLNGQEGIIEDCGNYIELSSGTVCWRAMVSVGYEMLMLRRDQMRYPNNQNNLSRWEDGIWKPEDLRGKE